MSVTYLGDTPLPHGEAAVEGDFVTREGERFFRIRNYHRMPPFFMAVVSGFDHWMFVSSTGGLTCGRGSPENALFPYYTDDKIHDACFTTGPSTFIRVSRGGRTHLWNPFGRCVNPYGLQRNLYKNLAGNRLLFEEINHDLELVFSYSWSTGNRFGFIRRATLENTGSGAAGIEILDGLRNLLPAGVVRRLQDEKSTLVDAYKQGEVVEGGAALFTLSSILTDRAEPSEALRATVAWAAGLEAPTLLLSENQLESFCEGRGVRPEAEIRGRRCAFYQAAGLNLQAGTQTRWYSVAATDQGPSEVVRLLDELSRGVGEAQLEEDIAEGARRLERLAAGADALQLTSDERSTARHFFNTLFNIMRGGVFYDGYRFPRDDFLAFAGQWNHPLGLEFAKRLSESDAVVSRDEILQAAAGDTGMERLALEYLPLTFSRRHGDPSRPWNHFSIDLKDRSGAWRLNYQGNWRDIFQNWEALSISYPEYIGSFIAKFVNASTADGYNPYRIGRDGFDWEVHDPDDPWSNIGYWGDHQVNYLLKLLELADRYHPGQIQQFFSRDIFVYADVPYRIRPYAELLKDPRDSVEYDDEAAKKAAGRVSVIGSDGRLLTLADGSIHQVNLMEKLLVTVLAKLGNFVPGGGIWMNTQRPEWNDANNALAGYGLSMVTLCYLRRLLLLLGQLLDRETTGEFRVSEEVAQFMRALLKILEEHRELLVSSLTEAARKSVVEALGQASQVYRQKVYRGFSGSRAVVGKTEIEGLIESSLAWLDHSIGENRRSDGLYHSYNLVRFGNHGFGVDRLDEMLEGQVAILNSACLEPVQVLDLLKALRSSRLYRSDKNSYVLYPDRRLPSFLQKNIIPDEAVEASPWLRAELNSGRREFVEKDVDGVVHFNGRFRNVESLREALAADVTVSEADADALCDTWETVFQHRRFTGRSGAMYKYEGLGCIYWHMVSKLLLAASETVIDAAARGCDPEIVSELIAHVREIGDGIGVHSRPDEYGAFPIDPYSHTTGFGGVQQPGMTGQVKEDIITRFTELGVLVQRGEVRFEPVMLRREELLGEAQKWHFCAGGEDQFLDLDAGTLAFSLCGVPIVYRLSNTGCVCIIEREGKSTRLEGSGLGAELSRSLFRREGRILRIEVDIPADSLS